MPDTPKNLRLGRWATILASVVLAGLVALDLATGHLVVVVPLLVVFGACLFAAGWERRQHDVARVMPAVEQASRLVRSMHAGRMGEWHWNRSTGIVEWDDEVHRLFGLEPGTFAGRFSAWLDLVHPLDRAMAEERVAEGLTHRRPFRFDHRCVWPDGEVHWINVVGEAVTDDEGRAVGAVGLAWDVDARHAELDERERLLEVEQGARLRAEFLARAHEALTRSIHLPEILAGITESAVPDLADWCTVVLSSDRPRDAPLLVSAHRDQRMREWALEIQRRFPYDPDAPFGAAKVIRTGERELLLDVSGTASALPEPIRGVLETADVDSVITVPIIGPLGVLGSLQLIRGASRPPFTTSLLEMTEDLAARSGAALNAAILFERQARSRAALETLQSASGSLARAITTADVAEALVSHAFEGVRSDAVRLFIIDEAAPAVLASRGALDDELEAELLAAVVRAERGERPVVEQFEPTGRAAIVVPMRVRDRTVGVLAVMLPARSTASEDQISMLFTLASRGAGALERARLYERDRHIALTLQRRLLPNLPELPAWLEAGAVYEPATSAQIGGDWFQVMIVEGCRVIATVGDAVGHGMNSAAAMGQLQASIATAVSTILDPAGALAIVDRFARQGLDTRAASVTMLLLENGEPMRYASAGHPASLVVHPDGSSEWLEGGRRPLLGFSDLIDVAPPSATVAFSSGDVLVTFTDGLVERRGEPLDKGLARLRVAASRSRHLPAQQLCEALVRELKNLEHAEDDVAVLVIRHR